MKTTWRGVIIGCSLTAMAACSPHDGDPNGGSARDGGGGGGGGSGGQAGSTADAGICTVARVAILGPSCATCIEKNCQALMASCTASSCGECLLGCTTCMSACIEPISSTDAGAGVGGDGGVPSGSGGDGGAPSCDKMRNGNCCSYASLANLEAQCRQALDSNDEAICASLMSQTRNFLGFCK